MQTPHCGPCMQRQSRARLLALASTLLNMASKTLSPDGLSCHCFNGDRSQVAVCPNSNLIEIYDTRTWAKLHTLTEHDLVVSAIDWSAANNKIVSCSHDRNAFVWSYHAATADEAASWKPSLVVLRINRAAMDVRWAADGLRFAVGSSDKCVPMCTYEPDNDWWICKMISKKIKSTVTCIGFHPLNGQILATGSTDFKLRIFSTYSADVDGSSPDDVRCAPFASPLKFGECYAEFASNSWVNCLAWSPSGNVLAYATHDSSIHFATAFGASSGPVVQTIRTSELPLRSMIFCAERALVAGGHEFNLHMYTSERGGQWTFRQKLDEKKEAAAASATGTQAARALFQNKTARGQSSSAESDTLWTRHENDVIDMRDCSPAGTVGALRKISTVAMDGRLVYWDLNTIDVSLAALSL